MNKNKKIISLLLIMVMVFSQVVMVSAIDESNLDRENKILYLKSSNNIEKVIVPAIEEVDIKDYEDTIAINEIITNTEAYNLICLENSIWINNIALIEALIENNKRVFAMTDNADEIYNIGRDDELIKIRELLF